MDSESIYFKKTILVPNPRCNLESKEQIDPVVAQ